MCRQIDVNPFSISIKGYIPIGARYTRPPKIPHYDNYCRSHQNILPLLLFVL